MQYTPVLNTGLNWQLFSGPGFTGAVDIPRDAWFHLRLAITGAQAKLYVADMERPALVMDDLKSAVQRGRLGLISLTGATCFADFQVRTTPDAAWQRHQPPMPKGTIVRWSLSPSYDALARNLKQPRSRRSRGRTSRPSRPGSSSSTAIARARTRASRSPTTGRSASSRSPG